jgi:hypothetical protein
MIKFIPDITPENKKKDRNELWILLGKIEIQGGTFIPDCIKDIIYNYTLNIPHTVKAYIRTVTSGMISIPIIDDRSFHDSLKSWMYNDKYIISGNLILLFDNKRRNSLEPMFSKNWHLEFGRIIDYFLNCYKSEIDKRKYLHDDFEAFGDIFYQILELLPAESFC